jgi:hypothetical protein
MAALSWRPVPAGADIRHRQADFQPLFAKNGGLWPQRNASAEQGHPSDWML